MVLLKKIIRGKPEVIHKLHDRVEFIEFVLQGCTRQNDRIIGLYLPGRTRYLRVPVLQALHLIHDKHVSLQATKYLDVVGGTVVGDNLVRFRAVIGILSLEVASLDDIHLSLGELLYFAAPLIFQGGRTEDEHGTNESFLTEKFGSTDGLDSLAETHLVGNDGLSGLGSKADAFLLVGVEVDFQQLVQFLVIVSLDEFFALRFLTNVHNKVNGILVTSECVTYLARLFQKRADVGVCSLFHYMVFVEIVFSQMFICLLVLGADTNFHAPLAMVGEIDGGVGRNLTMYMSAFLSDKTILHGFDMLAGTESGSLEIHARTIVPLAVGSTVHHLIFVVFLRVADNIFTWTKFFINTFYYKMFGFRNLLAQLHLPLLQAHLLRLNNMRDNGLLLFLLGGFLGRASSCTG